MLVGGLELSREGGRKCKLIANSVCSLSLYSLSRLQRPSRLVTSHQQTRLGGHTACQWMEASATLTLCWREGSWRGGGGSPRSFVLPWGCHYWRPNCRQLGTFLQHMPELGKKERAHGTGSENPRLPTAEGWEVAGRSWEYKELLWRYRRAEKLWAALRHSLKLFSVR